MRIGIEASCAVSEHPTGIAYSLLQLLGRLPLVGGRHEYVLQFNFVRPQCAAHFEERIRPLLRERCRARVCRVPARWMRPLQRWLPIDWTLGGCDVVHYPQFPLRAQRRGARVITVHDLIPITHGQHCDPAMAEAHRRALLPAVRGADAIIAVSRYTRDALIEHLGVPAERIRIVHHGVDPGFRPRAEAEVAALRARLGLRRPYVLALGIGDPRKNAVRLVEAFARCRADGVDLVLAGEPWVATPLLRARVAELGLEGVAHVVEYVAAADLPALYTGATAFAFPSLAEGFGLPVLEAMACGTPVIAAHATALPEVAGEAALWFDPADVEQISAALTRVLADASLRAQLRARGRARAAGFTWERAARETVAVYEAAA